MRRQLARGSALLIALAAAIVPLPSAAQTPVLLDGDMTVAAGASVTVGVGEAVAAVEERFVPPRLFEERGVARRAANVTYRLVKLAAFDAPQEAWLAVVNHEVFGHGGRLRELFDGPIAYRVAAPPPFGPGGGSTSFDFDREPHAAELLAVSAGGMEANAVGAALIARRATAAGRFRPRDGVRYLIMELDAFGYILGTGDEPEAPGHDVSNVVEAYNAVAEARGFDPLRPATLRREALVALANPMLAYAVFSVARHVATGAGSVPVFAIPIGGHRVLPLARYALTPFGTEWTLTTHVGSRARALEFDLSVGRAPGVTPWRIAARHRARGPRSGWHVELDGHAWRQPRLTGSAERVLVPALATGVMVRGRVRRSLLPLPLTAARAALVLELGIKSAGFVPGEPLRGGAVARAGVALPLAR